MSLPKPVSFHGWEPPLSFNDWPKGVRGWFTRKLLVSLFYIRDSDSEPIFEWVMDWFCNHAGDYIEAADLDEVWMSDLRRNNRRIGYDRAAVLEDIRMVVKEAQKAAARNRDAENYTDLDSWLEALHTGQLEWDGSTEREGYELVADGGKFLLAKRTRQRTWPRLCQGCSTEFRPDRANIRNCPDCRAKRRANAPTHRRLTLL